MKTLLMLLVSISLCGAEDLKISLVWDEPALSPVSFYINGILDRRSNQNDIGFAKTGLFNSKTPVQLEHGVQQGVLEYFSGLIPKDTAKTPVTVKIIILRVSERTGLTAEYAKAEAKIAFCLRNNDSLATIYTAEAFIEKPSTLDVTGFHGSNVQEVLRQCLEAFAKQNWQGNNYVYTESVSAAAQPAPDSEMTVTPPDPGQTLNVIMVGGRFGVNSTGGGATYYRYYDKVKNGWIAPLSYSFDLMTVTNSSKNLTGTFSYFAFSIAGIKKKEGTSSCLLIEGSIPFGTETINKDRSNFFVGIGSYQGWLMLPPSGAGFTMSIGPYESVIFNSELYPWDVGVKLRVGVQF